MRLLLDTHAVLWWLNDEATLSAAARRAIADIESAVFVSAASAWEIAIKQSSGKLEAPPTIQRLVEEHFEALPISAAHAWAAGTLPRHHQDPFDRMLVAQALIEELTIVTRDPRIARYDVPVLTA